MRDGGKGDAPRPLGVPLDQFDSNWDKIFKNAKILEERMKKDLGTELFKDMDKEENK